MAVSYYSILFVVADVFGVKQRDMTSHRKTKLLSEARQVAMWFMRSRLGGSFPEIAAVMKRHHSSVFAGVRSIDRRRRVDEKLACRMSQCDDKLAAFAKGDGGSGG